MDSQDLLTQVGVGAAAVAAAFFAYFGKKVPSPPDHTAASAVVAGVGLELGNRAQMDMVIVQLTRIADALDALADKERAAQREILQDIMQKLDKVGH